MELFTYPRIHNVEDEIALLKNMDVTVTEYLDQQRVITIQIHDSTNEVIIKHTDRKKEGIYTLDNIPSTDRYNSIRRVVDELLISNKLNKAPIKDFTIYGILVHGQFYVFALRNGEGKFIDWDKTMKFARAMNIGTFPLYYRGPYNYSKIAAVYDARSKFTDKETTDLLIVPDPPTQDTVKGKYDYLAFALTDGKKNHGLSPVIVANEFIKIFVKPIYIKEAYDFIDSNNLWTKKDHREIVPLIAYIVLKDNKREYELFLDKIINRSRLSEEQCKKDFAKELRSEIEHVLKLMEK